MSTTVKRKIVVTRAKMLRSGTALLALAGMGMYLAAPVAAHAALGPNLVNNPSFETQVNGAPTCWEQSGYGNNTVVFSDAPGHTGNHAESVTLTNEVNGDHKSLQLESSGCAPLVTAGHQYQAGIWYTSTTPNVSLTIFQHTSAGWSYWTDLKTLTATSTWTNAVADTPVIPAGVDQISFGISIYGNGTLITDDYALQDLAGGVVTPTPTPSATTTTPPVVTPTTAPVSTTAAPTTTAPPASGCTSTPTVCANGRWDVLTYPNTVRAVHSVLLANGKVLFIAGSGNDPMAFAAGTFKTTLWDPVSGQFTPIATPSDLFCSGHVQLPNGNVLVMGGNKAYPDAAGTHGYEGSNTSYIFNITTNTYQQVNNLNTGHWYPSATELGNGNVLTLGGLNENSDGTVTAEMFNNATSKWLPINQVNQTYSYWGLYPSMILMQDGRLFYDGSHVFGNQGTDNKGADILNYTANTITPISGLQDPQERDQSGAVLLPPAQAQKVMVMGGGNVDTNVDANRFTDIINLLTNNPTYTAGPLLPTGMTEMGNDANMQMTDSTVKPETAAQGKLYVSTVLLPDRTVLETGGALHNRADPVYESSIYSPTANAFHEVAVDPVERQYHSESFLLPDGRVVSVGSNPGDGTFDMRISIYSPAYLFQADKPTISSVDSTAFAYGSSHVIHTSEAIVSAELLKPSAVTHQSDPNQRLVDLPITKNSDGTYSVNVTSNPNLAPKGWYMMFVQNAAGTPSVATWVQVGGTT